MAEYEITVYDRLGNFLQNIKEFKSLAYARAVNNVGALKLIIDSNKFDSVLFSQDNFIGIQRSINGTSANLDGDSLWFIRSNKINLQSNKFTREITAYDLNFILGNPSYNRGRIVAYYAGSAYASKSTFADNMIKAIIRENLGTLATDTTRDISTYLSVEADLSLAPSFEKSFSRRNVLLVLQEICAASFINGTYLAFDILNTFPSSGLSFQFRTFTTQRGSDKRWSQGNSPIILDPEAGAISEASLEYGFVNEASYVYAGGTGEGAARNIQTASDTARISISPFNRREMFVDARNTENTNQIITEANNALRENRPRTIFSGSAVDTDSIKFGRDYGFGDYVTVRFDNQLIDCRVDTFSIQIEGGDENIDIKLKSDT
jgi:hypothetical protein